MNSINRVRLGAAIALALAAAGAHAASFPAAGTGPIPDAPAAQCGAAGPALDATFAVSGITGNVSSIGIRMNLFHSWSGDLQATLSAPGGSPSAVIFGRRGATTAAGCGNSADFDGNYDFDDIGGANFFAVAGNPTPPGRYQATVPGGQPAPPAGTTINLNALFGPLTDAQANGTWTLSITDFGGGDTGSLNAATLFLQESTPVELQSFSVD